MHTHTYTHIHTHTYSHTNKTGVMNLASFSNGDFTKASVETAVAAIMSYPLNILHFSKMEDIEYPTV